MVYLRERSTVWQCRYSVDGRWQRTSTNEHDLDKASARAHHILIQANVRKEMNAAPITRFFKDVAKNAIVRMQNELDAKQGKVIYKDYIGIINKYLIPFFGKYKIDSVTYSLLEQFADWRVKKMEKAPQRSTILNHNAALNRVFDEAVIRGFMVESNRPKLVAKGKKGERRPEFSLDEARLMRQNFDAWIEEGRADSKAVRALMRDYVLTLLDTGARPGNELLKLTWAQIELTRFPEISQPKGVDDEGDPIVFLLENKTAILKIQKGKTQARKAIGRLPTVKALTRIAERNYQQSIAQVKKTAANDNIFRYREYLNEEEIKEGKQADLLPPTSFSKLFDNYLETLGLLIDPVTSQRRVLYSLRHTHATLALTYDKVPAHTLAKQMGTSIKMIEDHYSHLDVVKAIDQLRGEESRQLIEAEASIEEIEKTKQVKKKKAK